MHKISIFRTVFMALVLLLGVTGGVGASPPAQEPSGDVSVQGAVTTAFTYQGNLEDDGSPANGTYDFKFELHDNAGGSSQVGGPVDKPGETVADGLFSVELDFGDQFSDTALWLKISVQKAGGGYIALSPLQPLTATPFAHYALDGWGGTWSGTGTGLTLSGGSTGLHATGTDFGVYGTSDDYGVYGFTNSTSGVGVRGYSEASTGVNYGVTGKNFSPNGFGVYGENDVGTGVYGTGTTGVKGSSSAIDGIGVLGQASGGNNPVGVSGSTGAVQNGRAVEGIASGIAGIGVYGESEGILGKGLYGLASSNLTGLSTYGVYGESKGQFGTGVYGEAAKYGVYGLSSGLGFGSAGVYGKSTGLGIGIDGVYGESDSDSGSGVHGFDASATGLGTGVFGYSDSGKGVRGVSFSGHAGYFEGGVYVSDRLGIGIETPTKAKVEINGFSNNTIAGTNGFYDSTVTPFTFATQSLQYSLYADNNIAAPGLVAFSDERMKQIKGRSDAARDLVTLVGIEVTDYTYIDTVTKGAGEQKKVIAQQVEEVYPQAVSRSIDVVPDIYHKAPIEAGWIELATDLQPGERVRLIGEDNQGVYEVLEVTPDGFRTDFVADGEVVFVFGREVDDFRSVDYDAIAMLNVSATQELNHLVGQQATEIEALNTRLAALEQAGASAQSNAPFAPWLLFGGLGVVGLVFVQKRRVG
jgi:hypothetical protein